MRAIALAAAASVALIVGYLALGGASYAPAKVADPCASREWRAPGNFEEVVEQIVLSTVDGAACELGVSRETIVLAFASRESLQRLAPQEGISSDDLEQLARAGLLRAVDDAERADALDPATADELRDIARRLPVSRLLGLLDLLPGA
jgi:hypothetical protein